MVNHFYTTLYNRVSNPDDIFTTITEPLIIPDRLNPFYDRFFGDGASDTDASQLALLMCKIVAGSTYRNEITTFDRRLTFDPVTTGLTPSTPSNDSEILYLLTEFNPSAINFASDGRDDLKKSLRTDEILQEQAAAVLVGIVEKVSVNNGV